MKKYLFLILTLAACSLVSFINPPVKSLPPLEGIDMIVEKYRSVIPEQMEKQGIPGFSVALVTDEEILWSEGFGCTDRTCETQVTQNTPFSIQSMSKSFTATAVLLGVQNDLLDLDEPIGTYLPDFTVNSIFDERPQDIITLRMLLSHTAGFTHEAPVGNNFDLEPGTWEAHIASISDTWLKFPAGQGWSYANLGIDLAGYILEQAAGMPFQQYAKTHLFKPLGMNNSTFDIAEIEGLEKRAIGHSGIFQQIPLVTIMPSGGVYASANDMARYMQFHISRGTIENQILLAENLIEQMYKPHFQASAFNNYGLGLAVRQGRYDAIQLSHGGGGFGFLSQMTWYPDLKIGVVWLSNSTEHDLQNWLADAILDDVIDASPEVYTARANERAYTKSATPVNPEMLSDSGLIDRINQAALMTDEAAQRRWKEYKGAYSIRVWGQVAEIVHVRAGKQLEFEGHPMVEVEPGLFFAPDGEALDFRGTIPTWRNIKLEKDNGTLQAQPIGLGFCAIVCAVALPWAITAAVIDRRRRKLDPAFRSKRLQWVIGGTRFLLALVSLLVLGTLAMLTQYPLLLFSGTPLPHGGLHIWQQIGFSMIYAAAGLTALAVVGVAVCWGTGLGTRLTRIWATGTVSALILFCLLVVL